LVTINDCRQKEKLKVKRVSGDLELSFIDKDGDTIFQSWFKMKPPYSRTWKKIEEIFLELKTCLEE